MTIHLCQLADFHAGLLHINHKVTETLVFGCIPVCARQQQAVLRVVGTGVPDFLAINDPFVAAQICPGRCTGQIGAAAGFAEELTPLVFPSENAAQVFLLLLMGSVGQQRDSCQHAHTALGCADGAVIGKGLFDDTGFQWAHVFTVILAGPTGCPPT